MTPTTEHIRSFRPEIERLGREFGVSRVRIFGSVARNAAKAGSDVDLLVRMEPRRSLLDLIGFEQSVE